MPEQALYLKWRPLSFEDVIGQHHVTHTLRNSLKTGRIRHAYLFSGPRGTGKTTTARLLAKAVNCLDPEPENHPCNQCSICDAVNEGRFLDLIEIDAATHTGVDDVRELRDKIAFAPGEGKYKVYIIDEVHRFSGSAFDALLKTLEEPPDHAIFVLATTEIEKVPATILSRCLQFEFRRVSLQEVAERLAMIAEREGLKFEMPAMELIARQGTGSVRDSISLLDQIVSDPEELITLDMAQRVLGTANMLAVRDLVDALINRDTAHGLHIINQAVDSGSDPRQFGRQVVEHLRAVMLAQTAGADLVDASSEERAIYEEQATHIERSALLRALRAFNESVNTYSSGWQPQLSLELALIESLQEPEPQLAQQLMMMPQQQTTAPVATKSAVAATPTEPEGPVLSGAPPVVPAAAVRDKWVELQRLINPHNMQLASLMDHVNLQSIVVDGNRVIVGAESSFYMEKLNDPERVRWINRAMEVTHQQPLYVRFVLSTSGATTAQASTTPADPEIDMDDPLIQEAQSLGGEIKQDNE